MAHFILSPFGSTGDLNPFIALGLGLLHRGHTVTFVVQEHFAPTVEAKGFGARLLSGNVVASLALHTRRLLGASNALASLNTLMRYGILPTLDANIAILRDACRDADMLVTSSGQMAGPFVADLLDIPWVTVAFSPVSIPSADIVTQPQPIQLSPSLQRLANRLQWGLGSIFVGYIADRPINRLRRRYGLAPLHESLWLGGASRRSVAVACSPALQLPPPDWPEYVHMTGFCFWDTPATWQPPSELTAFLAQPGQLVIVTAGSIGPDMYDAFVGYYQTSVQAIRSMGARALIIGPANSADFGGSADVLALPFAPYSLVFPHATAVIHHGGMGTTAQTLRYGVPSLIVPWGVDQFYAASQITRMGMGRTLLWRQYSARRAETALTALIEDSRYRDGVRAAQTIISAEDGAATLCDTVIGVL